ncbi:MAG: biotin/lipoyl-binding protein, partial [Acidobacteria bacterium]|nr:biotin/lipoyl-binding protein [Acidobacteriota bacterium]
MSEERETEKGTGARIEEGGRAPVEETKGGEPVIVTEELHTSERKPVSLDVEERRRRERRRRTTIIAVSAVALVAVVIIALLIIRARRNAAAANEETTVVVSVKVAKAEKQAIAAQQTALGTIFPRDTAQISPKISAQIKQMPIWKNRVVHAGDVIAVLESNDLQSQRNEAVAALNEARANARGVETGTIPQNTAQDERLCATHGRPWTT